MRCLVVTPQPFFTPRGTPFSVYYRTLIMSEFGADIDLLTYGEGTDVDIANVRIMRVPRFAWFGNVKTGPSLLKLFLDIFIAARTVGLLIRYRYDVVHAHEEAVFFCRFLKPIFRFKLIYDMHSSLPQQLRNFDYTNSRIVHQIFKKLENGSIIAADAVITICPDLAGYVKRIIVDPHKHFLIENSIFEPVKLRGKQSETTSSVWDSGADQLPANRVYFVYAGTLEPYQGIGLLIRSFRKVIERDARAYLLIVGGSADQITKYEKLAKNDGVIEHCQFTGRLSQQLAHMYMKSAAVLLSPRTEGTNTPLKIYQQLASGIPLVATNIYSHTQVLNDNVAFLADPEPGKFGEAMICAMADDGVARVKVKNALRLYEQDYSRESYVRKLSKLLNGLL